MKVDDLEYIKLFFRRLSKSVLTTLQATNKKLMHPSNPSALANPHHAHHHNHKLIRIEANRSATHPMHHHIIPISLTLIPHTSIGTYSKISFVRHPFEKGNVKWTDLENEKIVSMVPKMIKSSNDSKEAAVEKKKDLTERFKAFKQKYSESQSKQHNRAGYVKSDESIRASSISFQKRMETYFRARASATRSEVTNQVGVFVVLGVPLALTIC